jgi:hypothetical protein
VLSGGAWLSFRREKVPGFRSGRAPTDSLSALRSGCIIVKNGTRMNTNLHGFFLESGFASRMAIRLRGDGSVDSRPASESKKNGDHDQQTVALTTPQSN